MRLNYANKAYLCKQGPQDWLRQTAGAAAPQGLEPAAPNLPQQFWTGDRSKASGERRPARCRALHAVSDREGSQFLTRFHVNRGFVSSLSARDLAWFGGD